MPQHKYPTREVILHENSYQVKPENKLLTRYTQNKKGQFTGRINGMPQYYSDNVKYIQLKKDVNVHGFHFTKGEIVGRLKKNKPLPPVIHIKAAIKRRK